MKNRIIAMFLAFMILCSCSGQGGGDTSSTQSDFSGVIYDKISLSATSAWSEMSLLEYEEKGLARVASYLAGNRV